MRAMRSSRSAPSSSASLPALCLPIACRAHSSPRLSVSSRPGLASEPRKEHNESAGGGRCLRHCALAHGVAGGFKPANQTAAINAEEEELPSGLRQLAGDLTGATARADRAPRRFTLRRKVGGAHDVRRATAVSIESRGLRDHPGTGAVSMGQPLDRPITPGSLDSLDCPSGRAGLGHPITARMRREVTPGSTPERLERSRAGPALGCAG